MIHIDQTDNLFKYLSNLGVEDIEKEYMLLASNGRYKLNDVRQYFQEAFQPSAIDDIEEQELEKVVDYYSDLKQIKKISSAEVKRRLLEYKETKNENIKNEIINSQLKDILLLCVNYKTRHKDIDIQDLVQVANIGVIDAIEKYNPKAKIDFKDYVVYWTRDKILKEFKEKNND